jgi:hypothetical protein
MPEEFDFSEYNYHIDSVKDAHRSKKKHIILAIEALIIAGYPKEKIHSKLKRDLEGFANEEYLRGICSERGCTDQKHVAEEKKVEEKIGVTIEKESGSGMKVVWDEPQDKPVVENSSRVVESPPPVVIANQPLIDAVKDKIELLSDIAKFLKEYEFVSKLSTEDKKQLEEVVFLTKKIEEMAREHFDNRQVVPTWSQVILARVAADELTAHIAKVYLAKLKDVVDMSSKQTTKILRGITRTVNPIYEPTTEEEAWQAGYYGKPCKCGSWRVKWEFGWLHCFHCEKDWKAKSEKPPLAGKRENERELV